MEAAWNRLTIREPDWFEYRLFKGPGTNINLHVFRAGASEVDRMLRFRDWLRVPTTPTGTGMQASSASWRGACGSTCSTTPNAKNAVVREIMDRAEATGR
jgi:GrpB-like predicted nucleotidyltransferase (UPF0157 family)